MNPRSGAVVVHYGALVVSFALILVLARDQWFFGDDWAVIAPSHDADLLIPHVGHLNLAAGLLFPALRDWVGLGSYLPFLIAALAAHLAVAHLVWRIMLRVGIVPWIATGVSVIVMLLGGGAENIFWAFQFGFMGAIALGLLAILLADRERMPVVALAAVALLAPTFSGTAIPVLVAAAVVALVRHGALKTVIAFGPAAAGYLVWYLTIAVHYPTPGAGIHSLAEFGLAVVYAAAMYGGGLGRALPWIGLGVVAAAVAAVWFFRGVRRGIRSVGAPAYAMVIGSAAFVVLTAYSRHSFGITAAATPRYAYLTIVLLLPAFGIMLSALAKRGARWPLAVGAFVGVVLVTNVVFLALDAQVQAVREQASRERVLNSLDAVVADPTNQALLNAPADPYWATDLSGRDLLTLYRDGQLAKN
jgi:hypothetical protein